MTIGFAPILLLGIGSETTALQYPATSSDFDDNQVMTIGRTLETISQAFSPTPPAAHL